MSPLSAILGQPPANDDDITIVRAYNAMLGMPSKDPMKGFPSMVPRPPPGQYHYETRAPIILAYNAICLTLMVLSTGTRIAIRLQNYKLRFGWDDAMIIIATMFALISPCISIANVHLGGGGKHYYDLTYSEYALFRTSGVPRSLNLYVSLAMVKLSIILFYMRLNGFSSRNWKIIHWVLFFLTASLLVASVIFFTTFCDPIAPLWNFRLFANISKAQNYSLWTNPGPIQKMRFNLGDATLALNGWHIATDITLFIVPVAMLWKVKMKWGTKCRVLAVGFVGCGNIVFSACRMSSNYQIGKDQTWNMTRVNAWSIAEITLGVITASLPILSRLVTQAYRHISPKNSDAGSQNNNGRYAFSKSRRYRQWPGHFRNDDIEGSLEGSDNFSEMGTSASTRSGAVSIHSIGPQGQQVAEQLENDGEVLKGDGQRKGSVPTIRYKEEYERDDREAGETEQARDVEGHNATGKVSSEEQPVSRLSKW